MLKTLPRGDITSDEKQRALERLLASQTFSRSDQLKRFLQYICEKDIAGRAEEISEYSIAIEALGRPPDYSPADDSSVRTRAHALRQKLQEYYEVEDPDAEVRIDVPKGAYNPHFSRQAPPASPRLQVAFPAPLALAPSARRFAWRPSVLTGVAAGLIVACAILLLGRLVPERSKIDPILREAWGPMLGTGKEVEVCVATPPALLLHPYKDGQLPLTRSPQLPAPESVSSWYDGLQMIDGGGKLYMHTTQDVFLFGDSLAAASALQLLSASGARPRIVPESNLRAFTLRGQNVVLIGSPNYSPLAARFLTSTPFSIRYDPDTREEVISRGPPGPDTKQIFRPTRNERKMLTKAYGLVTVLPSQPHGDGAAQTVIFSGITSAGPQAALEFFRSPEGLGILKDKLRGEGYSKFPQAYQVVVRCGLDHNLALNWEYETHCVMRSSPLLN